MHRTAPATGSLSAFKGARRTISTETFRKPDEWCSYACFIGCRGDLPDCVSRGERTRNLGVAPEGLASGPTPDDVERATNEHLRVKVAGSTGLEPAASAVTGQRSNQLNYDPTPSVTRVLPGNCKPGRLLNVSDRLQREQPGGTQGDAEGLVGGKGLEPLTAGV